MKWPVPVKCYGRTYEVHNETELQELINWLVEGRKAIANRYRVGVSWPRGRKAKGVMQKPVVRPPEESGAVDLDECPDIRRCRCGRCLRCGAPKHCSLHGPMYGEAPGGSPWGHRYSDVDGGKVNLPGTVLPEQTEKSE